MPRLMTIFLGTLLMALLAACGPRPPLTISTNDALAQLDALQCPAGADPQVFAMLKAALSDALAARGKITCAPPNGGANAVDDFTIHLEGGQLGLWWHYRNVGDYDQDGTVGVSDITPIAMHWYEVAADVNSIQGVIDGSNNSLIDIADITPIAQNFGVQCDGYLLQSRLTSNDNWNSIESYAFSVGGGMGRKLFDPVYPDSIPQYYRVVPFDGAQIGVASNSVYWGGGPVAPDITGVDPVGGITGTQVQFTATVTGSQPITVSWDFGGGATPNQISGSQVAVTLNAPAVYSASVYASNAGGTDTFNFDLTVNDVPPDPPVINSVTPTSGVMDTVVVFSADVTGTLPFTYAWDFGGGAFPNTSAEESPSVMLASTTGDYSASLTLTNVAGEDTHYFTLTITDRPAAPVTIDPEDALDEVHALVIDRIPTIAYLRRIDPSGWEKSVYFTRANEAQGFTWSVPVQVKLSQSFFPDPYISLADIGGNPAVTNSLGGMIEGATIGFDLALDPAGSAWPDVWTFIHQGMGIGPGPSSLFAVQSCPAAAFTTNDQGGDLLFRLAKDPGGVEWYDKVAIAANLLSSKVNSIDLLVINGALGDYPAIAVAGGDLYYVRANDSSGNGWETPRLLDDMADTSSLAIVNGFPAIAYISAGELPRTLFYWRADDEYGDSWTLANRLMVDDSVDAVGSRISLADVSGRAAIAYVSKEIGTGLPRLRYAVATDGTGVTWNTPITVDPAVVVTNSASLIVSGLAGGDIRPSIAYCSYDSGSDKGTLRIIRAIDFFGLEWP
jgi:hypothetical protein